jgi:hypothetical protein
MPHFEYCPWCSNYIWDWFQEWYLAPEYEETKHGRLAMDCPHPDCRRPVFLIRGKLVKAPEVTEPVKRPIAGAEKWATDASQCYPDLVAFLTNPGEQDRAKYFRSGYWPEMNV